MHLAECEQRWWCWASHRVTPVSPSLTSLMFLFTLSQATVPTRAPRPSVFVELFKIFISITPGSLWAGCGASASSNFEAAGALAVGPVA